MYLDPTWNILTVGDGDLSFSRSLLDDHGHTKLVASTLDNDQTIKAKYRSNQINSLKKSAISIFHDLDVTDVTSFPPAVINKFDLVIFQFPLYPVVKSRHDYLQLEGTSSNLLNRLLIVNFINHSASHLLAPEGAGLCYITSKDVKPYCDWNLENIHPLVSGMRFLGLMEFDPKRFPLYKIRNVDRDKDIKATNAITFVWGNKSSAALNSVVNKSTKHLRDHCRLCGKGPFGSADELARHENSKTHQRKAKYQAQWLDYLGTTTTIIRSTHHV